MTMERDGAARPRRGPSSRLAIGWSVVALALALGPGYLRRVMVSIRLIAIAALLLAIGYLVGTLGSDGTADNAW